MKRDFFDAREGVQSGFTATGEPVFMMTMTPEGVKLVIEACRNWADHNCVASQEIALWVMHVVGQTMLPTLQHMPQVRHFDPFNHSGGSHGVDIEDPDT